MLTEPYSHTKRITISQVCYDMVNTYQWHLTFIYSKCLLKLLIFWEAVNITIPLRWNIFLRTCREREGGRGNIYIAAYTITFEKERYLRQNLDKLRIFTSHFWILHQITINLGNWLGFMTKLIQPTSHLIHWASKYQ